MPANPMNPHTPTRRQVLQAVGASVVAVAGVSSCVGNDSPKRKTDPSDDTGLDEVLKRLQKDEPKCKQGLSTHVPMVAETLSSLGFGDTAPEWLDKYSAPVRELPSPSKKITADNWKEALGPKTDAASWEGANHRWADWAEFFTKELAEKKWPDVLDVWVARFAPGMSGAATHGVIRTAHAARALGRRKTPERLGELARGLAYWASSYEELPAAPRKKPMAETFLKALEEVPLYREAFGKSPEGRNIVEVLRHVREVKGFDGVRDAIGPPTDLSAALSALSATFARVYLRYGTKNDTIAFVHAVTGPSSLRRLAPHLTPKVALAAFPYAWQTAAAVFSAYVRKRDDGTPEESKLTPDELIARAVKSGDEHAIKFTEVMTVEYAIQPDPVYLAAAEDAIKRL
jgi:Questin oxidase-like